MRPQTLLPLLLGGALAAGGILQGLQWRSQATTRGSDDLREEIAGLESEIDILRRENESLRSLAQGGGEISVDPGLIAFVRDAIGLDFRSTPVIHRIATEEMRQRVTASIESRYPPNGLDHREQAWSLMGLLTPADRFAPQLAATRSLGARSWFDDQTGDAWVTDRFDEQSIPDQSALVRALVRILLHQHYPPPPGHAGDDPERARDALHHGAAIAVENRFLARQALGIGFTGSQADSDARDLLASLPAYVRGLATFPSSLGTPRAERLMDQEELLGGLHRPPQLTAWYFPGQEEKTAVPPELPPSPDTFVLEESAGMLGIELWLRTLDPESIETTETAVAWAGDRYRLTARSDIDLDLLWDVRFDTSEAADAFTTAALTMAGFLAAADSDPIVGATVTSPEGRQITVTRPADRLVRFENVASE